MGDEEDELEGAKRLMFVVQNLRDVRGEKIEFRGLNVCQSAPATVTTRDNQRRPFLSIQFKRS